jgi:hypothetical protein
VKEDAVGEFMETIREKRKPFADITVAATAALTTMMGREAIYKEKDGDLEGTGSHRLARPRTNTRNRV